MNSIVTSFVDLWLYARPTLFPSCTCMRLSSQFFRLAVSSSTKISENRCFTTHPMGQLQCKFLYLVSESGSVSSISNLVGGYLHAQMVESSSDQLGGLVIPTISDTGSVCCKEQYSSCSQWCGLVMIITSVLALVVRAGLALGFINQGWSSYSQTFNKNCHLQKCNHPKLAYEAKKFQEIYL